MGGVSKPFLELGGRSVLEWGLAPFLVRADVVEVVVALGSGTDARDTGRPDPRVRTTQGGTNRFGSVANALDRLETHASLIAVHDGARPFPPPEAIDACIRLAAAGVGAVAGVPAVDTVKRVGDRRVIEGTPARRSLWHAQTPQVFPRDLFERAVAHARAHTRAGGAPPTDDAAMVERLGAEVRMVEASATNLKITRPEDMVTAETLIARGLV